MSLGFWLRLPTQQKETVGYPTPRGGLLGVFPIATCNFHQAYQALEVKNAGCFTCPDGSGNDMEKKKSTETRGEKNGE